MVTFGDNSKARVVGIGSVGFAGTTQVEQVLLVDGLKHNLLSLSQSCDEGNIVTFDHDKCIIKSPEYKGIRIILVCLTLKLTKVYSWALSDEPCCLGLWTSYDAFVMLKGDNIFFIT